MLFKLIQFVDRFISFPEAKAHCDVPCGIYDPIAAQIDALTVVRMMDLMAALADGGEKSRSYFHNSIPSTLLLIFYLRYQIAFAA